MTERSATSGVLYIVSTPIGNREDISLRALKVLGSVDAILSEDTRHSMPLLTSFGIQKKLIALHAHNEASEIKHIIKALLNGESFALISDAGTPLISDPGFLLVQLARAESISVVPIPGACALITALSASGIPCDAFTFIGFLPAKQVARQHKLTTFKSLPHTLIFYESTHRIIECIEDIHIVFGDACSIVIAKELTKAYENIISGTCNEVLSWFNAEQARVKGEFVVLIPKRPMNEEDSDAGRILEILLSELSLKQAVKLASQLTTTPKNQLYTLALAIEEQKNNH